MEELLIVSSTEALGVVDVVERMFSAQGYQVSRWNKDLFRSNDSYRQTLTDAAGFYDYAVAIFAADDPATIRDKPVMVTRANVVFEFGLFLGRLGRDRAFCLTEDRVTGFSDWDGITEVRYRRTSDSDIEAACDRVLRKIHGEGAGRRITNLPSTALALGYWHHYLQPVFSAFEHADRYHQLQIDHAGKVVVDEQVCIPPQYFPTITVKLPARISRLAPDSLARETRLYRHVSLAVPGSRPVSLYAEPSDDGTVRFFDIPATLLASARCIERTFSTKFLRRDQGRFRTACETRELDNFRRVIDGELPKGNNRVRFEPWA